MRKKIGTMGIPLTMERLLPVGGGKIHEDHDVNVLEMIM